MLLIGTRLRARLPGAEHPGDRGRRRPRAGPRLRPRADLVPGRRGDRARRGHRGRHRSGGDLDRPGGAARRLPDGDRSVRGRGGGRPGLRARRDRARAALGVRRHRRASVRPRGGDAGRARAGPASGPGAAAGRRARRVGRGARRLAGHAPRPRAAGHARRRHVHRRRRALLDRPGRRAAACSPPTAPSTTRTARRSRGPFRLAAVREGFGAARARRRPTGCSTRCARRRRRAAPRLRRPARRGRRHPRARARPRRRRAVLGWYEAIVARRPRA